MSSTILPKFYLVQEDILPEGILKTAKVKEILARKEALTINEAVEKVGLSRSAFYKYKEGVFPFNQASKEKIITLSLLLVHQAGVLSTVLNTIASAHANVLTINQSLPSQGVANATISIETAGMEINVEELIQLLGNFSCVKKIDIIGQS